MKTIVQLDSTGYPIPDKVMRIWDRGDEVQDLLSLVSKIKSALKRAQDGKDSLFFEVNFSAALSHCENLCSNIKRAKPYAVCPSCQGRNPDKCADCGGRGIVSETLYGLFDEKTRQIREKGINKTTNA